MLDREALDSAKRVLLDLEQELRTRLDAAADVAGPAMNSAVGRLSFIDAFQQHQMDLYANRKLSAQLASVRTALARINAGTYGVCERCGQPIPAERLEYMPDTAFCTPCNSVANA